MKKRTIIYSAIFPAMLLLLLSSCLDDKGENSQTFAFEPLVVDDGLGSYNTIVNSRYENSPFFYAPELNGKVNPGDCIIANFRINFDNQAADNRYYTISEISYEVLDMGHSTGIALLEDTFNIEYPDTIHGIGFLPASESPALIKNTLFAVFNQKTGQGKAFSYQMSWVEETIGSGAGNGNPTLYISAKAEGVKNNQTDFQTVFYAFNIRDFLDRLAGSYSGSKLTIDIKCHTKGLDKEHAVFEKVGSIQVTVPKSE